MMPKIKYLSSPILVFYSIFISAQVWNSLVYNTNVAGIEANPMRGFSNLYVPENNFPSSIKGVFFGLDEVMIDQAIFNRT